ncbi:MAG TPA: PadR family transcriptional regulator [Tepidisphaeraceae bacterium]|jgi:PadR family transcriptional regulator PadR|nr:PadR family transcriptional regulator [Tepidisphaeraceae bacterium]
MADQDLYSGLVRLHVLYHASAGVIFGLGMIRELRRHGYRVGPGTLYPILHRMERKGYLRSKEELVRGKVRRVYAITARGRREVRQATDKVRELYEEMVEGGGEPSPAHTQIPGIDGKSRHRVPADSRPRRGGEGAAPRR